MIIFMALNIRIMIIEVCANSLQSALNAQSAGADRIELCAELGVGGITPSWGLLKQVKELMRIPVHVLIRPRSGDFSYSDSEFKIMLEDITVCRDMGFAGVVSGVLHRDFSLDADRTRELKEHAGEMAFTFHRAFDWLRDPVAALGILEGLGVEYILSSGQQQTAPEGMPLLKELQARASGCTLIPGGGIRKSNAARFREAGFRAIHFSATRFHKTLDFPPAVSMFAPSFLSDNALALSDPGTIKEIVEIVK